MSFFLKKSTAKKDRGVRAKELFKIVQNPLSMFFEEKLSYQLLDPKPNRVMKNLFVGLAAAGEAGSSDLVDEMLRQVQKPFEENGQKNLLFGHAQIHRMLKDMITGEVAGSKEKNEAKEEGDEKATKLKYSATIAKILLKHFDEAIKGRGVFILLELIETKETQHLVAKQLKAQKKVIKEASKKNPKAKGLAVLLKKVEQA